MNRYILGIDGGGTTTLGVLFDEQGNEIERAEFGFSNFTIQESLAKENIHKTIHALLSRRKDSDRIHIVMGISGATNIHDKEAFLSSIENTYHATVELITDAELALYSIQRQKDQGVIMVISGTGSALMIDDGKKQQIIGGYGYLLGDEGSAYHLVISALKGLTKMFDLGAKPTRFQKKFMEELHIETRKDLVQHVYQKTKTELSLYAKTISELALQYKEAYHLLAKEGYGIGIQVVRAATHLHQNEKIKIALRGGFIQNAPFVKEALEQYLKRHLKDYEMEERPLESVMGAYWHGLGTINEVKSW
ncbi:MAG: ROK family protein [Acholeplasma sp.]|jgi:N-acetylglucosamine kinase-like BadF-type ATPase|nr:MAG: ROK family protein [Acholeplasma sp.]